MPARRFTDIQEAEMARRYREGDSLIDLARDYQTNPPTVAKALERQGIKRRLHCQHMLKTPIEIDYILRRYASGISKTQMQIEDKLDWKTITKYTDAYLAKGLDDDLSRALRDRRERLATRNAGGSTPHIYRTLFKHWKGGAYTRGLRWELTIDDLEALYVKQKGRCHYTRCLLDCPTSAQEHEQVWGNPYKVSIDRVDSDGHYTLDNVVLCCASINLCKRDHPAARFEPFLKDVAFSMCGIDRNEQLARTEESLIA